MKFKISRAEILAAAKMAARVAPSNAPVEMLNGILVECRDDGVFLTATNLETSIQMKLKASIEATGEMLVHPRVLPGMLALLPGDLVSFSASKPDTLIVTSGKCVYSLNCQSSKKYPKPVIPFPEDSVKMSGICSLAKRTVFVASKDNNRPVMQCVNVKLQKNAVHAAACDGMKMMLVKTEAHSPDSREFLLPAQSLQVLASISTDADVFEIGDIGNEIVFVRDDMMFTMRKIPGDFIDTGSIVKSIKPAYSAVVDAKLMRDALGTLMVGADIEPVNIVFTKANISLRRGNEYSEAKSAMPANITTATPKAGFYYNIRHLHKLFQIMEGKVRLELDEKGMMMVKSRHEVYVQTPQRVPTTRAKGSKKTDIQKEAA